MGRSVEDLSGRCHVKRMSRRKERLGFCVTLSPLKTHTHSMHTHARTDSFLIICQNASLYKLFVFMRFRDSRQRCSLWQSERQILDVAVWRSEGSQGRLHFDEWRLRNKHFTQSHVRTL